ncbi:hypothetical protein GA0115240_15904 [Streptomyces sp. DvalAA-14]|nr:hypothetical protein GA0115240_15904 [Streptomyces sp. DvalAA-14]
MSRLSARQRGKPSPYQLTPNLLGISFGVAGLAQA